MRKAVIDVGSNSVLLLVEQEVSGKWESLFEATDVTSLGAGTKETGVLSPQGVQRTLLALRNFFRIAEEHGATEVLAAATMAARIARNTDEFLAAADQQGTPVFVLPGEDEAQFGFESVVSDPAFQDEPLISIVDVGGQSTELVTAERQGGDWNVQFRRSFPIGTLALKGGVLRDECPSPPDILQAVVELDDAIGLCYRRGKCGSAVCLGATGTNLASIRMGLAVWDPEAVHGQWLNFGEISEAVGRLMPMTETERGELVGMEPSREATLPAGALILERVLNAIGAAGAFVSTRGWRHALLELGLPTKKI
jgi:exopolyphosphatase/guanosine-5'-triphosphate,3'-diphosphate pyrophosphatase